MFFGRRTSVDSWHYYLSLVVLSFFDAIGQLVVLGVWPKSFDVYLQMVMSQGKLTTGQKGQELMELARNATLAPDNQNLLYSASTETSSLLARAATNASPQIVREIAMTSTPVASSVMQLSASQATGAFIDDGRPKINAYLLDSLLGQEYAHSDLGVCIKILCLMIQFFHSHAFLFIIISLADHYARAIEDINHNLTKYDFRRLLKQLIILRDSSEQISFIISLPFASITLLIFMRQIALNGVFIQSTMQPFENWALSLQSLTTSISIFMVYIYCDGLQSASKQTHRLKTEQTVFNDKRGGNQSIYELLDYLNRLSKSIRITFFNIITINKSSLVGLYGHMLTLTFVTS